MAGILPRVVTAEGNSRTNAAVFCKQLGYHFFPIFRIYLGARGDLGGV